MSSFRVVREILDTAVGGPQAPVGFHGAFWRGVTRDEFVADMVFDQVLLVVGDGAASNLVRALKGEAPFGADLAEPPPGAEFNRMPFGRDPVPAESIAVIEQWIDDGCPDDVVEPVRPSWRATNAPIASSRTDDIWFLDPHVGWAVNSNGEILHTEDGFRTWERQFLAPPGTYLRCVGLASATRGWVGTLREQRRLYETSDGGVTWTLVQNLPPLAPQAICGLSVVDADVVYASGTNFPFLPARMMRTVDGGATWQAWDMSAHATLLVDTYFTDADHGWVVGGVATVPDPTRDDVRAVVLRTEDGGQTWVDRAAALGAALPLGEWGWKIHFIDDLVGYVALESFQRGAILKTSDGGDTWARIDINDPQGNINLEGVGFVDESTGWVGGWGSEIVGEEDAGFSSATTDGGKTWQDANEIGRFINRFRFFRGPDPVGYASGSTVYRYSAEPPEPPSPAAAPESPRIMEEDTTTGTRAPLQLSLAVPDDAQRLVLDIWDRFGAHVGTLVDETRPVAGTREIEWDLTDDAGRPLPDGSFILRVTVDEDAESRIARVTR